MMKPAQNVTFHITPDGFPIEGTLSTVKLGMRTALVLMRHSDVTGRSEHVLTIYVKDEE
jgi:hypothetical protein